MISATKIFLKVLVLALIFYYLLQQIELEKFHAIVANANVILLMLAIALQVSSVFVASFRWLLISKNLNFKESFSIYVKSYFKGFFFNQVLPGSISGDAIKIYDFIIKKYSKVDCFYSVFVDRIIGFVGLMLLSLMSNLIFYDIFPAFIFYVIISISALGLFCFCCLFYFCKLTFASRIKLTVYLYKISQKLNAQYPNKATLLLQIGLSMLVHLLSILVIYSIASSVSIDLDFYYYLVVMPSVFLLLIVPLSLAGWGIREGAMVYLFAIVGVTKEAALAISIIYGILLLLSSLPGVYFWILNKKQKI